METGASTTAIRIEIVESQPPVGFVIGDSGRREGFVGWLGLLRVLSEVLGQDDAFPLRP